jgi:flagellar biosynthesis protein FliP
VETQQYRKGSKALLVLIPLLGLTYVLVIAGPTEGLIAIYFSHIRAVLLSTQVCHFLLSLNIRLKLFFFSPVFHDLFLSQYRRYFTWPIPSRKPIRWLANCMRLYKMKEDPSAEYPSISTLANHFTRKLARVSTSKAN